MSDVLLPNDEAELADVVAHAAVRRTPLAVAGGATRIGLGRPMQTAATVSTAAMAG
ncbi:MAG: glycolate oxidase subunit GlcE, partial [Bauldia sp.]